jgi:hypothetical protein
LQVFAAFLRSVLSRETLPPPPAAPERPRARGSVLRWIFQPEPLPLDPEAPPRPRPGLLRALFVPEALPEDPPVPSRPRRNAWLRWLFGREPLDRP